MVVDRGLVTGVVARYPEIYDFVENQYKVERLNILKNCQFSATFLPTSQPSMI
jgi:hypothetical protein